jgi:L-asparaginase
MSLIQIHQSASFANRKVLIIYTGGTFGMKSGKNGLEPFPLADLSNVLPEITRFDFGIDLLSMPRILDSSNIEPDYWQELATTISVQYFNYQSFIILHGTDTMAYTASALSFMLLGIQKPVIFTGAQIPLDKVRNDARENLITALCVAQQHLEGNIFLPEVCICFGDKLLRANRSTKIQNQNFTAFSSPNFNPLAQIGTEIKFDSSLFLRREKEDFSTQLNTNILLLKYYPGMSEEFLTNCFSFGYDVIVIETFGAGNLPDKPSLKKNFENYISSGGEIYNVSQCFGANVSQQNYATSNFLRDLGVIPLSDMTTESALTKAMLLSASNQMDKMIKNLCGEISD